MATFVFLILGIIMGGLVIYFIFCIDNPSREPCTCPECVAKLDLQAAYDRAKARATEAAMERAMKEREYADVTKLLKEMDGGTRA